MDLIKNDEVEGDSIYMAPELLRMDLPKNERISLKADVFSLGVSLLEIATSIDLPQSGIMW